MNLPLIDRCIAFEMIDAQRLAMRAAPKGMAVLLYSSGLLIIKPVKVCYFAIIFISYSIFSKNLSISLVKYSNSRHRETRG